MNNSLLQAESNRCQYCCGKALESGNFGKANEELNEGISFLTNKQGPVARSMVSVNQRLIPWQRIGFDTA